MDGRILLFALAGMALLLGGPGPATRALAQRVAHALKDYPREQAAQLMHLPVRDLNDQLAGRAHISLKAVAQLPEDVYQAVIGRD